MIFPVTMASKSIHIIVPPCCWTLKMVLPVVSLVISRWNHVIPFTSGLTAAILIFVVGVARNIVKPETSERMCLCCPTDQCKPHENIIYISSGDPGGSFWPLLTLGNDVYGKSLGDGGLIDNTSCYMACQYRNERYLLLYGETISSWVYDIQTISSWAYVFVF